MKRRLFVMFLTLCLIFSLVPVSVFAADTMTEVFVPDTVVSENHLVYDSTGAEHTFSYTVPKDGATMLVFFSNSCGKSQTLFQRLNDADWVSNPYVSITAVEVNARDGQSLDEFINTYAPDAEDYIDFYYGNASLMWEYWSLISEEPSVTWPLVFLISEDGTVQYADEAMNVSDTIEESLSQMSSAFAEYKDTQSAPSGIVTVQLTGVLDYKNISQIHKLVNKERAAKGLSSLILDETLTGHAMMRAIECTLNYSHTRPDGTDWYTILEDSYSIGKSSENIAYGQTSPSSAMSAWMASATHKANILDPDVTHLGVGIALVNGKYHWVQLFHSQGTAKEDYTRTNNSVFVASIDTLQTNLKAKQTNIQVSFSGSKDTLSGLTQTITLPYGYTGSSTTCPLLPSFVSLSNPKTPVNIRDTSGKTIATIYPAMDGTEDLVIEAKAAGTAVFPLPAYEGQSDPTTLTVTVTMGIANPNVSRLAGFDRFETSFLVADQLKKTLGVSKFDTIIVASGADFADALSGSYLAAVKGAPILLGYQSTQNAQVQKYIKNNLASGGTVYILGGTKAIPSSMEKGLAGLKVVRLAGANRFETNLLVLKEAGVKSGQEVLVATGTDFADCLSASATGKPILLVYNKLMDSQKKYLTTLNSTYCIIGGKNAVNTTIETAMKNYGKTTRLAGSNRLETSVMVAERYFSKPDSAVVAYGWNYPDGLCGGSLAYALEAPLILTHSKQKYYAISADYTNSMGIAAGFVLGGESLVSDAAVNVLFAE